jgi:hypothetical protein
MLKQKSELRYIYKIHSSVLKRNDWNLNITLQEARNNDQLISLANNQLIDFIDEIKHNKINMDNIHLIKQTIEELKIKVSTLKNKELIQDLYIQKNSILFIEDIVEIVMDNKKDFDRCCMKKGFYINDIKYKRLLGTTGGIKKSTIFFVSYELYDELNKRLNNGRNEDIPLVPAKLEAYKALTCSSSIPVTVPKGILVVKDIETTFKEDVITIKNSDTDRPDLISEEKYQIKLSPCDGCSIILPSLAKKWTKELTGKNDILSGFCIRNSFLKGMLYPFDFIDFAKNIAHKEIVKDIWGNDININNVEMILTDNMLKLWNCYSSIDNYLDNCKKNNYKFRVTKYCEPELENERNLNYQFIQSYNLKDEEIDELIKPTVKEIQDVLGGDYRKTLLFLKGVHMTDDTAFSGDKNTDIVKALMIEPKLINDSFIRQRVYKAINKRIKQAKIGVLKVKGCYNIVAGDVYALCEHIFGMEVKGLLHAHEFYSKYWLNKGINEIVSYRAPMTCHNNIRKMKLVNDENITYWFRYMKTCLILNAWDTTTQAMNGEDFDGDANISTDNEILLKNTMDLPAIICMQNSAQKKKIKEVDLIESNKKGFGDAVGRDTNRITTMFERLANCKENSKEFNELMYRIMCGQHFQQLDIDKAKGIIAKSMPKEWYDYKINKIKDEDSLKVIKDKEFNLSILAEKKPYFFIYIYPKLMYSYKKYIKDSNDKCMLVYNKSINELEQLSNKTKDQLEFLSYYRKNMPVGNNNCIMNKICHKIENIFDNNVNYDVSNQFDYTLFKNPEEYSKKEYKLIKVLYEQYKSEVQQYMQVAKSNKMDKDEAREQRGIFKQKFKEKAFEICNNKYKLCNIVIDLCYNKNSTKQFVWDMCGDVVLETLLKNHDYIITYPKKDDKGNFTFGGYTFSMQSKILDKERWI